MSIYRSLLTLSGSLSSILWHVTADIRSHMTCISCGSANIHVRALNKGEGEAEEDAATASGGAPVTPKALQGPSPASLRSLPIVLVLRGLSCIEAACLCLSSCGGWWCTLLWCKRARDCVFVMVQDALWCVMWWCALGLQLSAHFVPGVRARSA